MRKRSHTIKEEQRKSFYMRQVGQLLLEAGKTDESLLELYVTRAEFSDGGGACHFYFSCAGGKERFDELLQRLILYKASLRRALARIRQSRYTPNLFFHYDVGVENVYRIESILNRIGRDG